MQLPARGIGLGALFSTQAVWSNGGSLTLSTSGNPATDSSHSLYFAGAIEAAFSVLAICQQFLPANINFTEPDPIWEFEIIGNVSRAARINYALSNSIGFGGTNATLVLKRV